MALRAQATLTTLKAIARAQTKAKLKQALKHQSTKKKDHTYSPCDKVLVWREKIVNNHIDELIGTYLELYYDEASKIVAHDQDASIKIYSTT